MQFAVSYKQIIKLAFPLSISLMIPQISFMANAAFVGRLGTVEMDINSLCGIYYLLLTWMGFGLSNGVLVIISRKFGENETLSAARIFSNAVLLSLVLSIGLALLSLWIVPALFGASLHHQDVAMGSKKFINLRLLGYPILLLTQLINVYFIATNRTRMLIIGSIAGNIINILFDYLLIFGKGGMPHLGLYGAAVASVLGEVITCAMMWGVFFLKKEYIRFRIFSNLTHSWKAYKEILEISAPLIFQYIFSIGGWLLFFIYVEHLGKVQLAASHIIRSVLGLAGIGTWALSSTCNTIVSNIIGQGKEDNVLRLVKKILTVSLSYAALLCIILNIVAVPFLHIYTHDIAVIAVATPVLRIMTFSILVLSLGTIVFNAVVGSGRTLVNMGIEIFCVCMYMLYVILVVGRISHNLTVAWMSEFIYWILLFILSGTYLLKKYGRRNFID